jgi:hypothetical protein
MAAYNACERNHKKEVVMSRTYRALTTLALSLALVATTAAVAGAAPPTGSAEDVHGARKALYQSELAHNLSVRAGAGTQATQATEGVSAARKALYESELAHNLAAAPQPTPAAPGRDVGVATIALLSLIVGLIGGAAVVAGIAANRRRHRVVAA